MSTETINANTDNAVVFDNETGEIYHHIIKSKKKIPSISKYIGIETKWPDNCVTKDSLIDSLSLLDAYLNNPVMINTQGILDSILENYLTQQQAKLIKYVGNNLTAWNYYIGSVKDLCSCGVSPKNIADVLKTLEPNAIRVLSRNKPFRGDIVIKISPLYAWKGDYAWLDSVKSSWYMSKYNSY